MIVDLKSRSLTVKPSEKVILPFSHQWENSCTTNFCNILFRRLYRYHCIFRVITVGYEKPSGMAAKVLYHQKGRTQCWKLFKSDGK